MGSITAYETGAGKRYRVRYRKPDRSQTDKRGFRTKRDADGPIETVRLRYASFARVGKMWANDREARHDLSLKPL